MNKITKAVIPCGGMGTRFLPITKAVSKEILPVVDTPVLAYIVDEAIESGITDILIVLGKDKNDIKKYFKPNSELEDKLLAAGKVAEYEMLKRIYAKANIDFTVQSQPKGSADAVYQAKGFTGGDDFVLSWGDDLIVGETPVMRQLMDAFYTVGKSILGVQKYPGEDILKYGVIKSESDEGRLHKCAGIVEKPETLADAPSDMASLGRYILTKDVYHAITETKTGKNNELQLTDTLNDMCLTSGVYAFEFEGKRYDMGDKFGALKATVELSLYGKSYSDDFKQFIKELAAKL